MTDRLERRRSLLRLLASGAALAAVPCAAHAARLHALSASQLAKLKGVYPADKPAAGLIVTPLRALLGRRYGEFDDYITVQTPFDVIDAVAICAGMQPRSGGDNAAFAAFRDDGALLAVIKSGNRFEYFGTRALASIPAVDRTLRRYS